MPKKISAIVCANCQQAADNYLFPDSGGTKFEEFCTIAVSARFSIHCVGLYNHCQPHYFNIAKTPAFFYSIFPSVPGAKLLAAGGPKRRSRLQRCVKEL